MKLQRMERMNRFVIFSTAIITAMALLTAGTTSAASWPEKGKSITLYVSSAAGGGGDIAARAVAQFLEKELQTKILIVNKPGGASQKVHEVYMAEAGTDGYNLIGSNTPIVHATYLDPERKATYSRKDIQLITNYGHSSVAVAVKKGSRYKTIKDIVAAAKANPKRVTGTASGPLTQSDYTMFLLEKATGIQLGHVFFDKQGEQRAALLGGHVDVEFNNTFELIPGQRSGEIETLAVFDSKEDPFLPGIPTAESQGYKIYMYAGFGLSTKTGTPMEIVNTVAAAVKRASAKPEMQETFKRIGLELRVLSGQDYANYWNHNENVVKEALEDLKKQRK